MKVDILLIYTSIAGFCTGLFFLLLFVKHLKSSRDNIKEMKYIISLINKNKLKKAHYYLEANKDIIPLNFYYGQLIYLLVQQNKMKEAEIAVENALSIDDISSELYNNISWYFFEIDNFENCLKYANESIKRDNKDPYPYVNKGNALIELKRFSESISAFNESLKLNPNFPYAISGLGIALYLDKQYKKSIPYLLSALKSEPNNIGMLKYLADAYYAEKDFESCITIYKILSKLIPESPWIYSNLGNLYCYIGDFTHAFSSMNHAIKLDSSCSTAYYGKARLYSLYRKSTEGLDCLQIAISLNEEYKEIAIKDELLNNLKLYSRFKEIVGI